MWILFTTACCGVDAGQIWAGADGDEAEVSDELGNELVRAGHAVAKASAASKPVGSSGPQIPARGKVRADTRSG